MKKKQISMFLLLVGYTLGVWKGYVALWKESGSAPVRVFPYSVDSLPPADRQALAQGIHAESKNQLLQLLEDYLS